MSLFVAPKPDAAAALRPTTDAAPVNLLITRDVTVAETVTASAAALAVGLDVVREPDDVRRLWRAAPVVLVGAESAPMVLGCGLPSRRGVYVIGFDASDLAVWSTPLEAAVICLPASSASVAEVLAPTAGTRGARFVSVVGASGGLGVSSLVSAWASLAAARGMGSAAVELQPAGGGLDLMFGVEAEPGWRWDELSGAAGQLGDLADQLPDCGGVQLVSMGRRGRVPGREAVSSVLSALRRSREVVFIDGAADVIPDAELVFVVGADVRSVAAARAVAASSSLAGARIVVRTGPGRRIPSDAIARALGAEALGVLRHDRRLPSLIEVGRPPGSLLRGRFPKDAARLLDRLLADD